MSSFEINDDDLHIEVESKLQQVRIYERRGNPDNYKSAFQIFEYGDRGMAYSINGDGFYMARKHLAELMRRLGLATLEGYVSDAHAKLITRMLRDTCTVTTPQRGECAGRDFPWIVVRPI